MTYLDGPVLTFSGDFQSDVSTVNNDVRHFDDATFEARFQEFSDGPVENGWWNPIGGAAFRLLNCRVRGVVHSPVVTGLDPAVGSAICGSTDRVAGKMVDLDPQWQLSSQIWGLDVGVALDGEVLLTGRFEPAGFRDIWFGAREAVRHQMTARYQSVLTDVRFGPSGRSPAVDALREATSGAQLSIRLVTYAYDTNHLSSRFTIGSVHGAIGPFTDGEPRHFVAGRRFAPKNVVSGVVPALVNYFYGAVAPDTSSITLDLGNALPVSTGTGAMAPIGDLQLALLLREALDEGDPVTAGQDYLPLGTPIAYQAPNWLTETSGIVRVDLPDPPPPGLQELPLALVGPGPQGSPPRTRVVIRETPGGLHVRADDDLHRADAGASVRSVLHVTRFGRPVPDAVPTVDLQPPQSGVGGGDPSAPQSPEAPIPDTGTPPSAVRPSEIAATGTDGRSSVTITTSDPGNPRRYVDGQLYQFNVGLSGAEQLRECPFDAISLVVFDAYDVPDAPTWFDHVAPILTQYGNLYPIMSQRLVRLGDYASVKSNRELLRLVFGLDVGDPNYMPVSRDLSTPKRTTLLRWLDDPDLPRGAPGPERAAPLRPTVVRAAVEPASSGAGGVVPTPKAVFARTLLGDRAADVGDEADEP